MNIYKILPLNNMLSQSLFSYSNFVTFKLFEIAFILSITVFLERP